MVKNLASKRENWFSRAVYIRGIKITESNPAYKGQEWRFRSVINFGHFSAEVLAHTAEDCALASENIKRQTGTNGTVMPVEPIPGFYNAGQVAGSFTTVTFRQEV